MYKTLEKSGNNVDGQSFRRGERGGATRPERMIKSTKLDNKSELNFVPRPILNGYFDYNATTRRRSINRNAVLMNLANPIIINVFDRLVTKFH